MGLLKESVCMLTVPQNIPVQPYMVRPNAAEAFKSKAKMPINNHPS